MNQHREQNDQWIAISGTLMNEGGQPISQATIIAFDVKDPLRQFRTSSDEKGAYRLSLPSAAYDLIFDASDYLTEIVAGMPVGSSQSLNRVLAQKQALPKERIVGKLMTSDHLPAQEWNIRLRPLRAARAERFQEDVEMKTTSEGGFELSFSQEDYLFLDCVASDGSSTHSIPFPKPAKAVRMEILLTSNGERGQERLLSLLNDQASSPELQASSTFHACLAMPQPSTTYVYLKNGLLRPGPSNWPNPPGGFPIRYYLNADAAPSLAAIWIEKNLVSFPYEYTLYVDSTLQALPVGPRGFFKFRDETNDEYFLSAHLPILHSLSYNSTKPNIVYISLLQSTTDYWLQAPRC
jgi:hypothetical protein